MRLGTIALLAGIVIFQQLPELPDSRWAGLLLISLPLSICFAPLKIPLWLLNGFLLACLQANMIFATELPSELEGKDIVLEGVVDAMPQQRPLSLRFEFVVNQVISPAMDKHDFPARIRLNWYRSNELPGVGQRWQLRVRLKQPHGFMNPGGFDYEGWLFRHGIRATGYVREAAENRYLGEESGLAYVIDRYRMDLALQIEAALAQSPFKGMIQALAIGQRDAITPQQWQVLVKSGTNHLMAISGLHVGLVAGMAFFLLRWLWGRSARLVQHWPAIKAGAVAAILAAFLYAALAGFAIPTQRALIMVVVFMLALITQRYRRPADGLLLALLLVLMLDPLAVMDAGFWLSFAAVGIILLGMGGRLGETGPWWRWGRVHLLIAVALMPLTLLLFQKFSLISPLANFIAVPVVSLLVVPLVLLGTLLLAPLPIIGVFLLELADYCMQLLWPILEWLATLPLAQIHNGLPGSWAIIPLSLGVTWLLLPRGWPGRWLGSIWLGVAFLLPLPKPQYGEAYFSLLDVGQGLAAVVQTENRTLLFDTGPKFSDSFDTGAAVVRPFLLSRGTERLDTLVISHGDNDHIGGARSILESMPVAALLSSVPATLADHGAQSCRQGQSWQWDGVVFEMLHPPLDFYGVENDASCVLKISTATASVLLTGDIERRAERLLLGEYETELHADVLVVPHHGSLTSSTPEFIAMVAPHWALFPVGYGNRFKLPRQDVVDRYQAADVRILATGLVGAIEFRLDANGISAPETYRRTNGKYWTHFPKQDLVLSEK